MVSTITSVAAAQGPVGSFEVMVKVTVPADISAADGVYTAVAEVASLKVPVPGVDQVNEVAEPEIEPASVNVVVDAQIVTSAPAFATAIGLIVNTIASVAALHGPAGSFVVKVKVTEPAEISAADGV
jgi:hypothetical protein